MQPQAPRESPFYCDLDALDAAERQRRTALFARVRAAAGEVRELSDGYALRLSAGADAARDALEFALLERRCCPFLRFRLELEQEGGAEWLHVTGREGVKAFLTALTEMA